MREKSSKWFIVQDLFFIFDSSRNDLFGAEKQPKIISKNLISMNMVNSINPVLQQFPPNSISHPLAHQDFPNSSNLSQFNSNPNYSTSTFTNSLTSSSSITSSKDSNVKKSKFDSFDPQRSLTINGLSNYNGEDVVSLFRGFGTITSQFFTYATIYIEF